MSLTLGEKLRQAREERGIAISEVAEQTRISAMYLELIENDDYRTLPGGIFNKGFVKSYAKYVGIDEQEALQDYAQLVAASDAEKEESPRTYRPEVLTDDRTSSSMIPTIIFAVIILGLMTWGILALVNYIQENQGRPAAVNTNTNTNANSNTASGPAAPAASNAPAMGAVKIEFKTTGEDIYLRANVDGKTSDIIVNQTTSAVFDNPKDSVEISYLKLKSPFAHLVINGKEIPLPTEATDTKGKYIQIKVNAETLPQLWQSGTAVVGAPASTVDANVTPTPATNPVITPARRTTVVPKPSVSPGANTAAKPTPIPPRPTPGTASSPKKSGED